MTSKKLRIIFMGSPDFAVAPLKALHGAGHHIVAVYAQPPRPAGRGQKLQKTDVQMAAEDLGLPVFTPPTLKPLEEVERFKSFDADVVVVAAYGLILRQDVLDAPKLGCINIHGSLLPRWRGAAPIHRAILAGDAQTGITIMHMDAGLDTGDMISKQSLDITSADTYATMHNKMRDLGADMIVQAINELASKGTLPREIQPDDGVTYANKIDKNERWLNWQQPSSQLQRQLQAFTPWPGVWCQWGDGLLRVVEAVTIDMPHNKPVGTLLSADGIVACGDGTAWRLLKVQREGKQAVAWADFQNGANLPQGFVFG